MRSNRTAPTNVFNEIRLILGPPEKPTVVDSVAAAFLKIQQSGRTFRVLCRSELEATPSSQTFIAARMGGIGESRSPIWKPVPTVFLTRQGGSWYD